MKPVITTIKYVRKGECDYGKCKAACCRSLNYATGDIDNDRDNDRKIPCRDYTCPRIGKDFKCSIYDKRPSVCSSFPESPWDLIYMKVQRVCSYWFEIEITKTELSTSDVPAPSPASDVDSPNDRREP